MTICNIIFKTKTYINNIISTIKKTTTHVHVYVFVIDTDCDLYLYILPKYTLLTNKFENF